MNKLFAELSLAVERAIYAGLGVGGAVNLASIKSGQEWKTAGIAVGLTAAASFLNSVRQLLAKASGVSQG